MKRGQLAILIFLVVVLGAAAFLLLRRSTGSWQSSGSHLSDKVVKLDLNQVAQVSIQEPEGAINLKKKNDSWVVTERNDYPANFEMISTFSRKVWELKPVQELKVGPSQLGRLTLLEPGQGTNSGTLVDFKDENGKRLTALLLGKKYMREGEQSSFSQARTFPVGRYVMPEDGSHRVILVSEAFQQLDGKAERWLDRDFIKIEKPLSITATAPTPTLNWKLERDAAAKEWKLSDLRGDEKVDAAKANQLGNTFATFSSFVDVLASKTKPEETGLDKPVTFTIATEDGFTYVLNIGKKNGDNYPFTVSVGANLPTARPPGKDEKPEEKEKLDKDFQTRRETLEKKLAKEKKFEGWIYLIPKYGVEQVEKNRADLIAAKPTPTPAPSAGVGPKINPIALPSPPTKPRP